MLTPAIRLLRVLRDGTGAALDYKSGHVVLLLRAEGELDDSGVERIENAL